jgi:membrane-bound serine protease (ClpP class)
MSDDPPTQGPVAWLNHDALRLRSRYVKTRLRRPRWFTIGPLQMLLALGLWVGASGFGSGDTLVQAQLQDVAVVVVDLETPIDRVSERYLDRAITDANDAGANVIVLELNTPGGLVDSTREMVGTILNSEVPVVVYVAPTGAQAASAGTFISVASAFLSMAPGTNIGAAAVIQGSGEELPETLGKKVTEDTTAFMRSIAEQRGRPIDELEATIRDAKAYSAAEALELGIADSIASDRDALLAELDGLTLEGSEGGVLVTTNGARVEEVGKTFFEHILTFVADPNVAFLLVSLGSLALIVELFNPGMWIPGILGVSALIVGWAGVGFLPFSWAGIALLALALALFVGEALAPGFGFFGIAGTIALILGGLFLVGFFGSPELPGVSFSVNRWVVVGLGLAIGLTVLWLTRAAHRSRNDTSSYTSPTSVEALTGLVAQVTTRLEPMGEVKVAGEPWAARLVEGAFAEVGEPVRVAGMHELYLLVEPLTSSTQPAEPAGLLDET